jgi:hypothetical protein
MLSIYRKNSNDFIKIGKFKNLCIKVMKKIILNTQKSNSLLSPIKGISNNIPLVKTKITTIRIKECHNIDFSFF